MYDFASQRKITTEVDCLILDGISFQNSAPAYLFDLILCWNVSLPMIYSYWRDWQTFMSRTKMSTIQWEGTKIPQDLRRGMNII